MNVTLRKLPIVGQSIANIVQRSYKQQECSIRRNRFPKIRYRPEDKKLVDNEQKLVYDQWLKQFRK